MAKKLDLNKIRDEIDKEKQNRNIVPSRLGESVGKGVSARDVFLNDLLSARQSGFDTPATTLIKTVENKVAKKHGGIGKPHIINESQPQRPTHRPPTVDMSQDRDEKLFADLEKKNKQTLAESISSFQGKSPSNPQSMNFGGTDYLTTPPIGTPMNNNNNISSQINEGALVENVRGVVNSYLSENLGGIFEEAIKGTIIEMYAVERIKEVLSENRDLIKSVVVETIREIQAKNKAKAR